MQKKQNPELRDLKTHQAGATKLHETRHTDSPVEIEPAGPPGAVGDRHSDHT